MADTLPPDLARALALARPRLGRLGSRVLFFRSTGSTNDVALNLAALGDHEGAVIVADQQTAGRGRRGHAWFSPAQSGLCASVVVSPGRARTEPARAIALLTLATGVALAEGIEAFSGLRPTLKWPNDVFIARRKFAGILAEASGSARLARRSSSATASTYGPRCIPRNLATARHRSKRNWAATSIGIRCSSKRWRRSGGATRICSTAGSMLFSTRGAIARRARSARRRVADDRGRAVGDHRRHRW